MTIDIDVLDAFVGQLGQHRLQQRAAKPLAGRRRMQMCIRDRVFAALFLGETLNGPQMLAAGLVFIGVAISQWRSAPPPPPAGVLN